MLEGDDYVAEEFDEGTVDIDTSTVDVGIAEVATGAVPEAVEEEVTVISHSSAAASSTDVAVVWPWTAIFETADERNLGAKFSFVLLSEGRGRGTGRDS